MRNLIYEKRRIGHGQPDVEAKTLESQHMLLLHLVVFVVPPREQKDYWVALSSSCPGTVGAVVCIDFSILSLQTTLLPQRQPFLFSRP
jgi:hypothetical protein